MNFSYFIAVFFVLSTIAHVSLADSTYEGLPPESLIINGFHLGMSHDAAMESIHNLESLYHECITHKVFGSLSLECNKNFKIEKKFVGSFSFSDSLFYEDGKLNDSGHLIEFMIDDVATIFNAEGVREDDFKRKFYSNYNLSSLFEPGCEEWLQGYGICENINNGLKVEIYASSGDGYHYFIKVTRIQTSSEARQREELARIKEEQEEKKRQESAEKLKFN